jgi:hypothetical protein
MANITATKNRIEGIIAGLTIGTYTEGYKTDYSYIWEIWTDQGSERCLQKVIVSLHHQNRVHNKGDIRIGIYQGHADEEATIPTMVWEWEVFDKADYYIDTKDLATKISLCIWHAERLQSATA